MDSAASGSGVPRERPAGTGVCHSTGTHRHRCLSPPAAHKLQSCLTGSKNHGQGGDTGWEREDPRPAPPCGKASAQLEHPASIGLAPVERDKPKDTRQPLVPFLLPLLSLHYFTAKEEDDGFILDAAKQTQTFWDVISSRTPKLRGVGSQGHSRLCPLPAMCVLEQGTRTTVFSLPAWQLHNS